MSGCYGFLCKCRLCNTRPKYLLGHTGLDGQLNSDINRPASPANSNASNAQFSAPTLHSQTTCSLTPRPSNPHHHNSSPSCHITSTCANLSTNQSSSSSDNQCSSLPNASCSNSPQCVGSLSTSLTGNDVGTCISDTDQHLRVGRNVTRRFSNPDVFVPSLTMRRCRSIDHYDFNSNDPPPYSWVAGAQDARQVELRGPRRGGSVDRLEEERPRRDSTGTLPPPYEMPTDQLPPSYEEALASSQRRSDVSAAEAPLLQSVRTAGV
ncbi:hypothetical protein FHG87_021179 [Trinorchestia longiramus]|nr:hypothetical protein FHG87_021179 [Trinorchestia longiramus]